MIKFFQNIRRRLLGEQRLGKYFIYAIGEIFLVVMGILIALQINNWNEANKQRKLELKTLSELFESFNSDLSDIEVNIGLHNMGLKASQHLLVAFDNKLPYHDSLDQHFGQFYSISVFINSTGAYETLKSRGMDIISNDSLRRQIVNIYDVIYHEIKLNEENFDFIDLQENKQFMFENMSDWEFFQTAKPNNFLSLSRDPIFRNRLNYTVQSRQMMLERYQWAREECIKVIDHLIKEMDRLKK